MRLKPALFRVDDSEKDHGGCGAHRLCALRGKSFVPLLEDKCSFRATKGSCAMVEIGEGADARKLILCGQHLAEVYELKEQLEESTRTASPKPPTYYSMSREPTSSSKASSPFVVMGDSSTTITPPEETTVEQKGGPSVLSVASQQDRDLELPEKDSMGRSLENKLPFSSVTAWPHNYCRCQRLFRSPPAFCSSCT